MRLAAIAVATLSVIADGIAKCIALCTLCIVACVVLCFSVGVDTVRAEDAEKPAGVDCRKRWGCWELMHASKGTVLGLRATVSRVGGRVPNSLDASAVTAYSTEHYATYEHLTLHFAASATLGGGTARTEKSLGVGLDFGWRAPVSPTSGPFLRAGTGFQYFGHDVLDLMLFEPLQARAGYQILEKKLLIEVGLTEGFIPLGHYGPGRDARRNLNRATELGGYAAVHLHPVRVSASLMHLFPETTQPGGDLNLARAAVCTYQFIVTLCGDAFYMRGPVDLGDRTGRMTYSLYTGLTIGLSP